MDRALVTGGGGFVGSEIIRQLLQKNVKVEVVGRNRYPHLENMGIKCNLGDIVDYDFLKTTLREFDVVFHVAALAGIWGNRKSFERVNVEGTRNVLNACVENKIPALVHTSTPSVVFRGDDIIAGDETLPYSDRFLCDYARTKAEAEKFVLAADQSTIRTCAIRPHLVWGPGDPHIIPRLIQKGKKGRLKIVGDGQNEVDISYIENVATSHILAAENLLSSGKSCGRAYFIGQERQVQLWPWINDLFVRLDIPQVTKKVDESTAYTIGGILEKTHRIIFPSREPAMTRFLAEQLSKSHYFSHQRARDDFGYVPQISIEEGMDRLVFWLKSI